MKSYKYKAVIVDDESDAREIIALLLHQMFPGIEVVDKVNSVAAAAQAIPFHNPDIVFLDIKMADGSGFDLLARLPNFNALVIFITAYDTFAIKAIKASAFDYLMKPIDDDEFRQTVNKAMGKLDSQNYEKRIPTGHYPSLEMKKVGLPNLTGYSFVDARDIIRCEADGHYTNLYFTNQAKTLVSKNLLHFESELVRFGFFRIHHKHLINLNYITSYSKGKGGGYLTMVDGAELEVATRKKAELMKIIAHAES